MLLDLLLRLDGFLAAGGVVLWAIAAVSLLLWSLILERFLFFWFAYPRLMQSAERRWTDWAGLRGWRSERVRAALLSELRVMLWRNISLIRTLIAACPLLGLLGTVTGMIRIFDVMAFLQGGDATGMAAGVSLATIPTMAGLVVALSGILFIGRLGRQAQRLGERSAMQLGFEEGAGA
ncbi:MAG: MotA/TolQ/ExbB proton channel family protein [Sedimenticolaceae bacterium]